MNRIFNFFKFLFSASSEKISNITTSNYTETETDLYNIITAMVTNSTLNQIHCDLLTKKYFVTIDNRTLVIDGVTNKIYMLIECKPNQVDCEDVMYPFVIRESVVTDFIDILAKRKHQHTTKIYERIEACEKKFLSSFENKVKAVVQ